MVVRHLLTFTEIRSTIPILNFRIGKVIANGTCRQLTPELGGIRLR